MSPTAMMMMDEVAELLEREGPLAPVDLSRGSSGFALGKHIGLAIDAAELTALSRYGDFQGMSPLRAGLSRFCGECYAADVSADRIIVTDGASGALMLAFGTLLEAGTEVILPEWGYPLYPVLADLIGAKPMYVPLTPAFKYDLDALERAITPRTHAIVLNNPVNPFGTVYTLDELRCVASLGVPVISDEVYALLTFERRAPSMLDVDPEALVVNSFSKTFALPGLRIGYLLAPPHLVHRAGALKRHLNAVTSIPSQVLAAKILPHWRRLVEAHVTFLRGCRDGFFEAAVGLEIAAIPKAGFFATVLCHAHDSADAARDLCLRYRLAVAPASDFAGPNRSSIDGRADGRPPAMNFVRVNFAAGSALTAQGVARLREYLCESPPAHPPATLRSPPDGGQKCGP